MNRSERSQPFRPDRPPSTDAAIPSRIVLKLLKRGALLALAGLTPFSASLAAEPFDIVLKGGLAMDPETGLQAVRDIGVRDGRIAAISEAPLSGTRIIDARGRVVAPGFVDLHSHAQNLLGGRVQAFDGVTTAMEDEVGQLPVAAAYDRAARSGRAINYGFSSSWALARATVLGGATPDGTAEAIPEALEKGHAATTAQASAAQTRDILKLVGQGLDEGAVGIGLALGYMPGAGEEEVFKISRLAAARGVPVFVHMRSTVGDFAAMQEVVADAAATGAQWHIMHVYWDSVEQRDLLEAVRAQGGRVTPETKGWFHGATYIGATFLAPEALKAAGQKPDSIIYYGRHVGSYAELADLRARDPRAFIINLDPATDDADLSLRTETARRLATPGWVLASDAMPWTQAPTHYIPEQTWPLPADAWSHPRSAATYTRIIENYVGKWKLVGLMDVLRAGSYFPARELEAAAPQFRNKGRLKVGADADLIVFDPDRIRVRATLEQPAALSAGMDYVLVNGQVLIAEGRLDPTTKPGRPIRREASATSR